MGVSKPAKGGSIEATLLESWKRFAAQRCGSVELVAKGVCYLDPRPCPFEARADFEARFRSDCIHCSRLQERVAAHAPVPEGSSGIAPTLGLLLRLLEEGGADGAEPGEDGRYAAASLLLRALPLFHAATNPLRVIRLFLGGVAGAFPGIVDDALFFEVVPEGDALRLAASFRRADVKKAPASRDAWLDADALERTGAFDGSVYEKLREEPIALDEDRDLLADAVYDGRSAVVAKPSREMRLPTSLVEHLPEGPAAIVPVFGRERVRGVLVVAASAGIGGFTAEQLELLACAAAEAGLALDGGTMEISARRRADALHAIEGLLMATQDAKELEEVADAAAQAVEAVTAAPIVLAWVRALDGSLGPGPSLGEAGAADETIRATGETLRRWFDADARPVRVADVNDDPRFSGGLPEEWGAAVAVPLRLDDRTWGVVAAIRRRSPHGAVAPFDAETADAAALVGHAASSVLARVREGEKTREAERRLRDAESQLRHADKAIAVGERGMHVAQEIRNPIAAIAGIAKRLARDAEEGSEKREYLDIILRETERLERVLGEQLSLAQMTRPRLKLQSVNILVQEALEQQSDELVRRRVRLLKRLSPDVPSLLLDEEKIRQVLSNVLQHALASVPAGGRMRVETRTGGGMVQAEVAHDGPKVPGESLDRLFVPFSATRRYGAGVGLAVAYQVVREHGGEIRARSEGDWSSIVTVYLPLRENTDRRAKPDRRAGRNDRRKRSA
ncbi:MAG TPA: ATP-binding protein [Candidatus Eisenbacteria bacterium]|nr:ATP-binding protein [Candidatus Eisenbacteria bacterium]